MRSALLELYKYAGEKTKFYVADIRRIPQTPALRGEIVGDFELGRFGLPWTVNSIGMKLVKIPAGDFLMGNTRSPSELVEIFGFTESLYSDESPRHRIRISSPFYCGATEVTQGQWKRVMGTKPWREDPENSRDGSNYAAGSIYAWYDRNTRFAGELFLHEAGRKLPNAWGLYDMHGNASKFCSDWADPNFYKSSPSVDPQGPASGQFKVRRGGSLFSDAKGQRTAWRFRELPDERYWGVGFRVVCEID